MLLINWPRTIHHSGNLLILQCLFESSPVVQRLSHCSYYRFTAYMKQLTHKAHSLSADVLRRPDFHISHQCGSWLFVTSATDSRKEADSSSTGVLETRLLGRYEGLFVLFTDDWSMTPWLLIIGQSSCHLWEALEMVLFNCTKWAVRSSWSSHFCNVSHLTVCYDFILVALVACNSTHVICIILLVSLLRLLIVYSCSSEIWTNY